MRASGFWLLEGSHRNMVKSSEPDARRSGRAPRAASYLRQLCNSAVAYRDRMYSLRSKVASCLCPRRSSVWAARTHIGGAFNHGPLDTYA